MGTTTFYLRRNDYGAKLSKLKKKELKILDELSPYKESNHAFGWDVPFELHNGNVYILILWQGKLMKLEEAPKILNKKYYSRYKGKTLREYEWTLLKNLVLREVSYLDKNFKKELRRKK